MQTVEIDKALLEDMLATMKYLHTTVMRMWRNLQPPIGSGKWLTPYATANALCVTPRVLQTMKNSGKIGYFQEQGGNCLYKEEEIAEYLSNNRVEADGSL